MECSARDDQRDTLDDTGAAATLIAMAIQVIGDNVARALCLVAALSVVRFRPVVKETYFEGARSVDRKAIRSAASWAVRSRKSPSGMIDTPWRCSSSISATRISMR